MSRERDHSLFKIREILVNGNISENDVCRMLTEMRNVLEHDNLRKEFRMLYFFCNWASHSLINKDDVLFDILDPINVGFSEIFIPDSNTVINRKDYADIVKDAIDLKELKNNLVSFFNDSGIEDIPYNRIIELICRNVLEKKVQYPRLTLIKDNGKLSEKQISINEKINERNLIVSKNKTRLNQEIKFQNQKLDPNIDYSKICTIKSFKFIEIANDEITILMEIDAEKPLQLIVKKPIE